MNAGGSAQGLRGFAAPPCARRRRDALRSTAASGLAWLGAIVLGAAVPATADSTPAARRRIEVVTVAIEEPGGGAPTDRAMLVMRRRAGVGRRRASPARESTAGRAGTSARSTWSDAVGRRPTGWTVLTEPGALPARWFEPDSERPVVLELANDEATLGAAGSATVFRQALGAWTRVGSALVLRDGGRAVPAPSVAGGVCDGRSQVQFDDPFDEIDDFDPERCVGVLAVSGFCRSDETVVVGGVRFERIVEGDVTLSRGLGACFGAANVAETLAHEIGHILGLGHSSEDQAESDAGLREALMYAVAHHDERGPRLNGRDVAGVSALYPRTPR